MKLSNYNLTEPDHWSDDPQAVDARAMLETLSTQVRELEEENAWLRYSLEKYGLLDTSEALYAESHFTEESIAA